jgi:hypothetical protein
MNKDKRIWIFRVNDGENFSNSKYPFWGVKRGRNGCIKTMVTKIAHGDILCFMTSKLYGGKIIGMGEYTGYFDRMDEPLLQINTKTNSEQNWKGDGYWDIQIHYDNLYITKAKLPIILISDPTIIWSSGIVGNIVEITRNDDITGVSLYYRVIRER